jgi:hypothetical protein
MVAHAEIDGLLVKNNTIIMDAAHTSPGCWGIGFNNMTNASQAQYYRNAVFSGNTIVNAGNLALTVSSCPNCVIENNVIIQNWAAGGATGISVPEKPRDGTRGDDLNTANTIRNNTIWFGPNASGSNTGISVNTEGTNYVISNNTVSSSQTSGSLNCFNYSLELGAYDFINNNHCYSSSVSNNWVAGYATLAAWWTHAPGFDTASITGNPLFPAPGTDFTAPGTYFTPATGSPLIGAGTAAHMSATDLTGKAHPVTPAIGAFEP